jgi:membrane glycosyltransferase
MNMHPPPNHTMPPEAPLAMVEQAFGRAPTDPRATLPRWLLSDMLWRLGALGPALAITMSLIVGLARWFNTGGFTIGEGLVVLLVGATFIWVSLTVGAVALALVRLWHGSPRPEGQRQGPQTVAILVPIYNEDTADVMGNIAAMRAELAAVRSPDRYAFFILSDTQDDHIAGAEARMIPLLQASGPADIPVYYRRRATNTNRKIGNLYDWITRWGADWDAMIVLDADSLMTGAAIRQLSDALARDPDVGLIQSFPILISADTLFGRMQEFATSVYGWLLAQGLALWSRNEGNYWGHNAIIRTRAFAHSAQLPHLRGRRGRQTLILSHDFVEAGLMRRAGWAVRFLPWPGGSYEETPATLIDHVLRDRRWCRGNMQHLRILSARGFHPISRFHLLQGAMAYLLSPAWFALLVIWAAFLPMNGAVEGYFSAANPLYPVWPQISRIDGLWFLALIYLMLLLPKIVAAVLLARTRGVAKLYGGGLVFAATTLTEMVLSILYAPILMVQQSKAVLRAVLDRPETWAPQQRNRVDYGWGVLMRFHWLEVVLGAGLALGIVAGALSLWLLPVTISLLGAPVLSRLSALRVSDRAIGPLRLDTPCSLREPRVARMARAERARLGALLAAGEPPAMAAE